MHKEKWLFVSEYHGIYKVSNHGRVKSVPRPGTKGGVLKPTFNGGYYRVYLYKDGKCKMFFVHRLVAIHFIPNPKNKPEVNHKDTNKRNNFYKNLEWSTKKENASHAAANGCYKGVRGSSNNLSKLSESDVMQIKSLIKKGYTLTRIAKIKKVSVGTVFYIKKGTTWSHVGTEAVNSCFSV